MIIIREFGKMAESHAGQATVQTRGPLVTDDIGFPIATQATPATGANIDSAALTAKTHFVEIQNSGATVIYYAVRPKRLAMAGPNALLATNLHRALSPGGSVMEAVYPSCIINFLGG